MMPTACHQKPVSTSPRSNNDIHIAKAQPSRPRLRLRRRILQEATVLVCGLQAAQWLQVQQAQADVMLPPEPQVGNCVDCIGEVQGALNACPLNSPSCISVQNDDERHFVAPWAYDGDRADAINALVSVATGGYYAPGLLKDPLNGNVGISRSDTAGFIGQTVLNVVQGKAPPAKPKARLQAEFIPFDGCLSDQHTAKDGSVYVRVVFGLQCAQHADFQQSGGEASTGVIDAEFVFPPGDSIVSIRAASRADPQLTSGTLQLSFAEGLAFERNLAKLQMERLRKALRWQVVDVVSEFDPKFNNARPLWFERFLLPRPNAGNGDNV